MEPTDSVQRAEERNRALAEALEMGHRILIQRNMTEDEREVADMMWAALATTK